MEIPAHPSDPGAGGHRRLYARAARDAYQALLESLAPSGRPLFLPAYVGWSPREGSGLFDPVRATGVGHRFYPLDARLQVDVEALEPMLEEHRPAALVLVHWFGFAEPATARIAELCAARDVLLVEDCCHCLGASLDGRALGETGDYAMVSLHKVLPSAAGGFLQANGDRRLPTELPDGRTIDSRDLAVLADADVAEAARRRRRNYRALADRVAALPGVRLFHDDLPDGAVPLNLPILVEEADRFEVYKAMRAREVGVVALYHTLVDALDPGAFPGAFRLSERILNLPVHQELDAGHMDRIAAALEASLEEVAVRDVVADDGPPEEAAPGEVASSAPAPDPAEG